MAHKVLSERVYRKVRKMVIERCERAKASGKRFARHQWADESGNVCAIGAVGLNGNPSRYVPTPEAYALAVPHLLGCGVPLSMVGGVIDAISNGFEDAYEPEWPLSFAKEQATVAQLYPALCELDPEWLQEFPEDRLGRYYKLGMYIGKKYGGFKYE